MSVEAIIKLSQITDQVRIARGEDSVLAPHTREAVLSGKYNGKKVLVKPVEHIGELNIVKKIYNHPISLVIGYNNGDVVLRDGDHFINDRFIVEEVATTSLESAYQSGSIDESQLGSFVGEIYGELHALGISYSQPPEDHLFMNDKKQVKIVDFGSAEFIQAGNVKEDLVSALQYLSRIVPNEQHKLAHALETFTAKYFELGGDVKSMQDAMRYHLKFANQTDPIRPVIEDIITPIS